MIGTKYLIAILTLLIVQFPGLVFARWSLIPHLYVEQQYDDNVFVTEDDKEDDFATIIAPGITMRYETPTRRIDLDYQYRRLYYYEFTDLDYDDHRGRLVAGIDFGPRLSVGVRDVLIRSEDPIEFTGTSQFERPSIRIGQRNKYIRNVVEPEATVRFGERNSLRLGYRNEILRNEADDVADQDTNAYNALLTFRPNTHNGLEFYSDYIDQSYGSTDPPEPPRDYHGNEIRGRYTYYFNPITSAHFQYRYYLRDFNDPAGGFPHYEVHNPSIGISRELLESLSLKASAGYDYRDVRDKSNENVFSGQLGLSGQHKELEFQLDGSTGFGEDLDSAESLGFYQFWAAGADFTYQLLQRLSLSASGYFEKDDYKDIERVDKYYTARGNLTYQPLKWLFLSILYEYNERDSSAEFESFTDNRYFFRITVQYDVAEQFQQ
jgi:hypothetical protein